MFRLGIIFFFVKDDALNFCGRKTEAGFIGPFGERVKCLLEKMDCSFHLCSTAVDVAVICEENIFYRIGKILAYVIIGNQKKIDTKYRPLRESIIDGVSR